MISQFTPNSLIDIIATTHSEAQINIGNNLASEFISKSETLTFKQILKNIKLGIKPTLSLHLHPQTIDLKKNSMKNYLNIKLIITIIVRKDSMI